MSQDFKCFKFSKLLMIQKSNKFMLVDVINVIMLLQMTFRCDHDIAHTVTFILEKLRSHEPVISLLSLVITSHDLK